MPDVEISIHGVSVKLSDEYGDMEEMTGLALGLSGQLQEQWRALNLSHYDSTPVRDADDTTTDEVTT